jgi:hypothetical protein
MPSTFNKQRYAGVIIPLLIMPALDAGIFLADERMTGSSPVKMREII